ncbi:MAG: LysM peptidoglycan-binding domain-containing protein [Solirubrobacteraceae bacterium]
MVQLVAAYKPRGRRTRYLAPVALVVVVAACVVVAASPRGSSGPRSRGSVASRASVPSVAPYWTVRQGDTYTLIAAQTGLTVAQLEAFNRDADPMSLVPGERLNLWAHPPAPRPKPLGPLFWTVRIGQSFGSIADQAGVSIATLEALNPRLHAAALQPGDQVRLRPGSESSGTASLTVAQLEAFNPPTGPLRLVAKLPNVWGYPPAPRPKPRGPLVWTVRSGQSFGSIADQTGVSIATLEALNPRLQPATLQPGDRVRLRQ